MTLLSLQDAELAFGLHPLLDRADLVVSEGERIGLIGRNGTGKSSLLKVIAGQASLDDGQIKRRDGLAVVLVEQEPELPPASSLRESLAVRGRLDGIADERERWRTEARLVEFLHRFGLDEATAPESASGGSMRRRHGIPRSALPDPALVVCGSTRWCDRCVSRYKVSCKMIDSHGSERRLCGDEF